MIRTGERFGAGISSKFAQQQRQSTALNALNLKTYSAGADMSAAQWRRCSTSALIREGWCDREEGE